MNKLIVFNQKSGTFELAQLGQGQRIDSLPSHLVVLVDEKEIYSRLPELVRNKAMSELVWNLAKEAFTRMSKVEFMIPSRVKIDMNDVCHDIPPPEKKAVQGLGDILSLDLEEIDLSTRAYNALHGKGVRKAWGFFLFKTPDLMAKDLRNFGKKSVAEIGTWEEDWGLDHQEIHEKVGSIFEKIVGKPVSQSKGVMKGRVNWEREELVKYTEELSQKIREEF